MAVYNRAREMIIYRTIKSAVRRGYQVEYWALKMYEQYDAGNLTDEHLAELEDLIQAYYDAQDGIDDTADPTTEEE